MAYSKILQANQLLSNLPQTEGYLIAYSGGADSTALLHLLSSTANIRAIHINHGLQSNALAWQMHCQKTCEQLDIPFIVEQAQLKDSSENTCRLARYAFFDKHLKNNETLLTAHHAQDQAETVLLKLIRGTGINGITGMAKFRKFSDGYLARPLLDFSPQVLKDYLIKNKINWIEDPSNNENNFKRNFLRNQIIPLLQQQFPNVVENISRSAINSQLSLNLLEESFDIKDKTLSVDRLISLPELLQTTLFYHWLSHKKLPVPDKSTIKQITSDFILARKDKNPHYKNNYYQLFRWEKSIYCLQNFEILNSDKIYRWHTSDPFTFPNNCGTLDFEGHKNEDLIIKFNQKGEKIKTHKHQITKSVKQLFQENHIPPWQRLITPFIYQNDELISLGYDWSHQDKINDNIRFNIKLNMY